MTATAPVHCRCCAGESRSFDSARVLGKYPAAYFRCERCGFIQPETAFWLAEAYGSPMTAYDLGGVMRPTENSQVTKGIITTLLDPAGPFLDFGGGYGVFTRWMRDWGYDFWHYDTHAPNLFAHGFATDLAAGRRYELVTAFEVFEHLEDPVAALGKILALTDTLLFSTEPVPTPTPQIADWWYYGPEHGQHVAFYTAETLHQLAGRFGAHYLKAGRDLHLFTRRPNITPRKLRFVLRRKVLRLLNWWVQRPSLLPADFHAARQRAIHAVGAAAASAEVQA